MSALRPGYFRAEYSVWRQEMVAEMQSLRKHELHYLNSAGFWWTLADWAQKMAVDVDKDEEGMIICMAAISVF